MVKLEFLYARELDAESQPHHRCYIFTRLTDEVSAKEVIHLVERLDIPDVGVRLKADRRTRLHRRLKKEADDLGMCVSVRLH